MTDNKLTYSDEFEQPKDNAFGHEQLVRDLGTLANQTSKALEQQPRRSVLKNLFTPAVWKNLARVLTTDGGFVDSSHDETVDTLHRIVDKAESEKNRASSTLKEAKAEAAELIQQAKETLEQASEEAKQLVRNANQEKSAIDTESNYSKKQLELINAELKLRRTELAEQNGDYQRELAKIADARTELKQSRFGDLVTEISALAKDPVFMQHLTVNPGLESWATESLNALIGLRHIKERIHVDLEKENPKYNKYWEAQSVIRFQDDGQSKIPEELAYNLTCFLLSIGGKPSKQAISYAAVNTGIFKALLEHEYDIMANDFEVRTPCGHGVRHVNVPIHVAVKYQNVEAARILLENGGDVNAWGADQYYSNMGQRLIWEAVATGNADMVQLLVDYNVRLDQNIRTHRDSSPPLLMALRLKNQEIVKILLSAPQSKDIPEEVKDECLSYAVQNLDLKFLQILLDGGLEPRQGHISCVSASDPDANEKVKLLSRTLKLKFERLEAGAPADRRAHHPAFRQSSIINPSANSIGAHDYLRRKLPHGADGANGAKDFGI